jgi:hypothetical protein
MKNLLCKIHIHKYKYEPNVVDEIFVDRLNPLKKICVRCGQITESDISLNYDAIIKLENYLLHRLHPWMAYR